jgi:hypothetical protein
MRTLTLNSANQFEIAHETKVVFTTHLAQEAKQKSCDIGRVHNDERKSTPDLQQSAEYTYKPYTS